MWLVRPLVPDRHCKPLKRIMTSAILCVDNSVFSVDTLHVKKDFPFCIVSFALLALRRLVDDYELGDVSVSLFTVQLRCAFIHFRVFSLTLKQFFFKFFNEVLAERK